MSPSTNLTYHNYEGCFTLYNIIHKLIVMKNLRLILASAFSMCLSPLIAQLHMWVDDSKPLIHDHCARYHQEEGVGPFSIRTYEDVFFTTSEDSNVMQEDKMLPCLADPIVIK